MPTEPPATQSPAATATVAATITLRDDGCELDGPAEAPAGLVTLELEETSSGLFDADLWRLQDGHAYGELAAHIAEEQRLADAGLPGLGHPTFADLVAEETGVENHGQLTAQLDAAAYGVACIEFEDETPVRIWTAGPITITD